MNVPEYSRATPSARHWHTVVLLIASILLWVPPFIATKAGRSLAEEAFDRWQFVIMCAATFGPTLALFCLCAILCLRARVDLDKGLGLTALVICALWLAVWLIGASLPLLLVAGG
jgi:hypothetical protein